MGNDCFSCCRCLVSQHSPSSSSPPLRLSALTPCPAPPLYNKRRSAGTAALLTDLLLPPAATLFKPFVLLRKKKKNATSFEVRQYNMSKNIERKIKWALEEGFLSQSCSLSLISQDHWFFRGRTRKIEEKRNQGLIRIKLQQLYGKEKKVKVHFGTHSRTRFSAKHQNPGKELFLGKLALEVIFSFASLGQKTHFICRGRNWKSGTYMGLDLYSHWQVTVTSQGGQFSGMKW